MVKNNKKWKHLTVLSTKFRNLRSQVNVFSDIREGQDAVDFRTQAKIKIYSFNSKDPSF